MKDQASPLIVADISGNHGGYIEKALELIRTAALCGCDYAKFQLYNPTEMYDGDNVELYRKLAIPRDWLTSMFNCADDAGIGLFASVFDVDNLQYLLSFDIDFIKLASPQSTWLPTHVYQAILEDTPEDINIIGSCDERDLDRLYRLFSDAERPTNFLYCPSGHPPIITDKDLNDFQLMDYYGFSDHTPDLLAPLAFAQAGAKMIEKHLKLDNNCVDAVFSADALTMGRLCELVK